MEDEWDGKERRNCNGCSQTNLLEERRVADRLLDDERWEMLKRWGKLISIVMIISIGFASLLATVVGGGGLWILKGVRDQSKELTVEIKNLGMELAENTKTNAVTQQSVIDIDRRLYDVEWKNNAMWVTLPKKERKALLHNYVKENH